MEPVSRDEMLGIEEAAVEDLGVSTGTLMEFAGLRVAEFVRGEFSQNVKIAVICGPGHNGGDGAVAARKLESWGFNVMMYVPEEEVKELTEEKIITARKCGVEIYLDDFPTANVYIDALLGYNLEEAPREPVKSAVDKINKWSAETVSVDVPTGIDVDSGERYDPHVDAEYTVTLGMPKKGLYARNSGDIYLADVGLPRKAVESAGVETGDYFSRESLIEYETSEDEAP
ncbi:MAG: NAD(P)H-hydrate epimerase [Candidatus Nanosalina sp.]